MIQVRFASMFLAGLLAASATGTENNGWIPLFNGKDLSGWTAVIAGQNEGDDPTQAFSVHDGVIHVYQNAVDGSAVPYGVIMTDREYSHYRFRVQYCWGTKKFAPRLKLPIDAGILYHCFAPRTQWTKSGWPLCVECQIQQNDVGDIWLVGTSAIVPLDPTAKTSQRLVYRDEKAGGIPERRAGCCIQKSALYETDGWNTVEIEVRGDQSVHRVNGHVVARMTAITHPGPTPNAPAVSLTKGRIALQAEAAEVFYRDIAIQPLPETEPVSAADSLRLLKVRDGFEAQLVASEPEIADPVAIDWGADGRLWVAEMHDYPVGVDGKGKAGGRVRVLKDADGDGRYEQSTLFLDKVNFPNGIMAWRDGVLITAAPDIIFARDTDNDGKADEKKVLYTGLPESNQQLRVNGLRWGLDNWIYCANGWRSQGMVRSTTADSSVDIKGRDLRIRPDAGLIEAASGPSQFGRDRDDWDNWFGCMNAAPLWHYVLADHYLRRHRLAPSVTPYQHVIAQDATRVFPAKTPEKRYHSFHQSGHFTSACSPMVYRDELLFPRDERHAFACEPFHNLVQHVVLSEDGPSFKAKRDPAETAHDFVASADRWFRPVMARTGPDGALWVVDMYRYVIEHPEYLPPEGRAELAPYFRMGSQRGRIYRIIRKGTAPRPIRDLTRLSGIALADCLRDANGLVRDLAHRRILQQNDIVALGRVRELLRDPAPRTRLHALRLLGEANALDAGRLRTALMDEHPEIRRHALAIIESRPDRDELLDAVLRLSDDVAASVRLQLACSLGFFKGSMSAEALAELARRGDSDRWLQAAVLSSLNSENVAPTLAALGRDPAVGARVLGPVLLVAFRMGHAGAIANAWPLLLDESSWIPLRERLSMLSSIAKTYARGADIPLDASGQRKKFATFVQQARAIAFSESEQPEIRIAALELLGQKAIVMSEDIVQAAILLNPRVSPSVQSAALGLLGSADAPQTVDVMLAGWERHAPGLRAAIVSTLASRPHWRQRLLDEVGKGTISVHEIDASIRQQLLTAPDKQLAARAREILKETLVVKRAEVVAAYQLALDKTGHVDSGRAVFKQRCSACHRLEDTGFAVGPDLRTLTDRSAKGLLHSILDPSAAVDPRYRQYLVQTEDGRLLNGLLIRESESDVVLLAQEGKSHIVPRNEIEQLRATPHSMMPEGLEKDLTVDHVADLIAYLQFAMASAAERRTTVAASYSAPAAAKTFRAGAAVVDVSPPEFPVIVNGGFLEKTATAIVDPLAARSLVLDDGSGIVVLCVVDSCMMPREFLDEVKAMAAKATGIPMERMLISATHTHTAPAIMGALGARVDPKYPEWAKAQIARSIETAYRNLQPAAIGWAVANVPELTHNRQWIRRPDRVLNDPFGQATVRSNMHPGYENADVIGPSGPTDPALTVLALRRKDGRPLAVFCNYSMHYFGAAPVSADYFGLFCDRVGKLVDGDAAFAAVMAQGTSGDLHWMDYGRAKRNLSSEQYANELAAHAVDAYRKIEFHDWVPLAMAESEVRLRRRVPDRDRLAWADAVLNAMGDRQPKDQREVYAREARFLHEEPERELKLQAIRIGELGVTAIPNEVFALTGLKLKAQSPLSTTMNIELANGGEGYIPPPEQHVLGGYTTWPARTAALETQAEPKIVDRLLTLLEQVSSRRRRQPSTRSGQYSDAVLRLRPIAYWPMGEMAGAVVLDRSNHGNSATLAGGYALFLPGPDSAICDQFVAENRGVHFAGGLMKARLSGDLAEYTIGAWFWNGLPAGLRSVTGGLIARQTADAVTERVDIDGSGKLSFGANGRSLGTGSKEVAFKQWNHVALVRGTRRAVVYLNGEPVIIAEVDAPVSGPASILLASSGDSFATLEGKLDEACLFDRTLSPDDIRLLAGKAADVSARK